MKTKKERKNISQVKYTRTALCLCAIRIMTLRVMFYIHNKFLRIAWTNLYFVYCLLPSQTLKKFCASMVNTFEILIRNKQWLAIPLDIKPLPWWFKTLPNKSLTISIWVNQSSNYKFNEHCLNFVILFYQNSIVSVDKTNDNIFTDFP